MQAPCLYAVIQYDGRDFAGWQRQPSDRTVQAEVEGVLERLDGRPVVVRAAGRTDAGVHALGQVVSFSPHRRWDLRDLLHGVRSLLPPDIWVSRLGRAPEGFDARRHAIARRYRYVVGWDPAAFSPFRAPYEWALTQPLDADALRKCAQVLLGRHDFRGYSAVGQKKSDYCCDVTCSRWDARGDAEGFIFMIEADRFLHRMVRFVVGTMVDVARGRRPLDDVRRLLQSRSNRDASAPAPAHGLYLVGVRYSQLEEGYDR